MDGDLVVGIAALAVALAAVGVSVWEGMANREQNRLAVRPSLVIHLYNLEGSPFRMVLQNNGLGPAVIRGLRLVVDPDSAEPKEFVEIGALCVSGGIMNGECWSPDPEDVVEPGAKMDMLSLPATLALASYERRAAIQFLKRVEFRIAYESLYEESFDYCYRIKPIVSKPPV